MGLFDKVFGAQQSKTQEVFNPAEAFAAICLSAIASDGYLADEELDGLVHSIRRMQLFKSYPHEVMRRMFDKLFGILRRQGADVLFNSAKSSLPFELREAAFAVATDLVLADGVVTEQEQDFLNQLYRALEIEDNLAVKIVEVMMLKNRG